MATNDKVHKATAVDDLLGHTTCKVCGEPIHRVIGGQGRTYVHTATGAVAGPGSAAHYGSAKMDDYKVRLALALARMFPEADGTYTTDQVMEAIEVVGQ